MESTGSALKIHISDATKRILEASLGDYTFKCRGKVDIKGIGEQTTWWLSRASNAGQGTAKSRESCKMRTSASSASKDGLYTKNGKMRSENSFHRRSSGVALERSREKSMDFGIRQNAMRSNRNLIGESNYNFSIIPPERTANAMQQTRVNHSENQLLMHHHLPQTASVIEFPNGTKRGLALNHAGANTGKLLNGNRAMNEFYDYNDRLINEEMIGSQFNDPNSSEHNDSYEDSLPNLDTCHHSKRQPQLGNRKFQIGCKPSNDYDYYSSSETVDKKSRSCTDLKIF